jgi:hypothetical protein
MLPRCPRHKSRLRFIKLTFVMCSISFQACNSTWYYAIMSFNTWKMDWLYLTARHPYKWLARYYQIVAHKL